MKKIIMYSSILCSYCKAAKKLFEEENLQYSEILIDNSSSLREDMIKKSSGRRTVPQIFFGNSHIGGFDDLQELKINKKLMTQLDEKKKI